MGSVIAVGLVMVVGLGLAYWMVKSVTDSHGPALQDRLVSKMLASVSFPLVLLETPLGPEELPGSFDQGPLGGLMRTWSAHGFGEWVGFVLPDGERALVGLGQDGAAVCLIDQGEDAWFEAVRQHRDGGLGVWSNAPGPLVLFGPMQVRQLRHHALLTLHDVFEDWKELAPGTSLNVATLVDVVNCQHQDRLWERLHQHLPQAGAVDDSSPEQQEAYTSILVRRQEALEALRVLRAKRTKAA